MEYEVVLRWPSILLLRLRQRCLGLPYVSAGSHKANRPFGLSYTSSEIVREPLRSTNISFENFKEASRTRCSKGSGFCRAIIDVQVISRRSERNGKCRQKLKWFSESHIASAGLKMSYRNSDYCDCVFRVGNRAGIIKVK